MSQWGWALNESLLQRVQNQQPMHKDERREIVDALRMAWVFPVDPALVAKVESDFGVYAPTPVALGETVIVVQDDPQQSAQIYALSVERAPSDIQWGEHSLQAWKIAASLATAVAPIHLFPQRAGLAPPQPKPIYTLTSRITVVDSRSIGLSFLLSLVSRWSGQRIPSNVVCVAGLDDQGTLEPVANLPAKLQAISEIALGVNTVVVSNTQAAEAREAAISLKRSVRIIACQDASEAVEAVFGPIVRRGHEGIIDNIGAQRSLRLLRATVLSGKSQHWSAVIEALQMFLRSDWSTDDDHDRSAIEHLLLIARRNRGDRSVVLAWDDRLIHDRGNAHVAEIVQSAADAGDDRCEEYVLRAIGRIEVAPSEPGSIQTLAACAAALGAMRQYNESTECAREAVRRWLCRNEAQEAASSLALWLRTAALCEAWLTLDDAVTVALELLDDPVASIPVNEALIAALVLAGRFELAIRSENAARSPIAARWLARAYAAIGRTEIALDLRKEIAQNAAHAPDDCNLQTVAHFAKLDAALERKAPTDEVLRAIRALNLRASRWIVALDAPVVANEYSGC